MKNTFKFTFTFLVLFVTLLTCSNLNKVSAEEVVTTTREDSFSIDDLQPSEFSLAAEYNVYTTSYYEELNDDQKKLYSILKDFFLDSNGLPKEYTVNYLSITPSDYGIDYSLTYSGNSQDAVNTLWNNKKDDFSYAFFAFIMDNPQAFWTSSYSITTKFSSSSSKVKVLYCDICFNLISGDFVNNISTYNSNITAVADEIKSKSKTTYDIFKNINDYLVDTCTYDKEAANSSGNDAYAYAHSSGGVFALTTHTVVCDGYAKSYKALSNLLGVDCAVVVGVAGGGNHAWNYVKLGNYWYPVDATWNDTGKTNIYFLTDAFAFSSEHVSVSDQISSSNSISFAYPILNTNLYSTQCENDGHSYIEYETVGGDCTTKSSVVYICNYCNKTKTVELSGDYTHSPAEAVKENIKDPTCTEDGSYDSVIYCSKCNAEISRETVTTEKFGHDYKVTKEAKEPTCTENGYSEVQTCSRCNNKIGGDTIKATGHSPKSAVVENYIDATCTANGSYDSVTYCSVCNAEISRETISTEALGHDYKVTKEAKAPTCTEDGYSEERTCSRCGDVVESKSISATGHTAGSSVTENKIEATCTSNGSYDTVTYCLTCGAEINRITTTINKLGHDYKVTKEAKSPTCTENGNTEEKTCTRCNDKLGGATISATGHSPKSAVIENQVGATCTANGSYDSVVYYSTCNAEISRTTTTTQKLGHDYKVTKEAKTPTCTENGYTEEQTCSRCGDKVASKTISATGHKYTVTKSAKAATCTENGYTEEKTCSSCGDVISSTKISAKGHTASSAVIENKVSTTCTSTGSYDSVVYCSDCGAELSRTSKTIAKTGHSYTSKVVSATYQAKGYTLHTCKNCGTSYKDTYTNLKILTAPKLTVSNISSGVKLSWNKISGATGYVIYRDNKVIKTITSSSTITFTDTSVKTKNGTKYCYKIMAYAGSTSVNKSALTGKTIYRLTTLSISKAYNSASKAISVYWTKNSSATGYQVQYSLSSDFSSSSSKWVTKNSTLSTKITGLTKGKYYYVRVRSYKIVGGVKYYSGWRTYSTKIKISK